MLVPDRDADVCVCGAVSLTCLDFDFDFERGQPRQHSSCGRGLSLSQSLPPAAWDHSPHTTSCGTMCNEVDMRAELRASTTWISIYIHIYEPYPLRLRISH